MARAALKILHLRDSPWVDGPGRTILESASHFDPARIEYHIGVFAPASAKAHPLLEALLARGASVYRIDDSGGLDRRVLDRLSQLIDDLRIDVLHTSELRSSMYGWLCRRRYPHLRLVTTTHGWIANTWRRKLMRLCDKALLRQFDAVVMVSRAMRGLVPEWWLPSSKVTIIHNALPLATYAKDYAHRERRTTNTAGNVVMLNVGRLSPEKGQALLLRAFSAIASDHPGVQLWLAGTGPLEPHLRTLADSLGLRERVRFLGYVADMPALYSEVDVVVQSSLTEGMPNVILEAAYLRVPVIATAVGGTAEIVDHEVSGCLIPAGSMMELVAAMRAFLSNPERFAAMARKGRERVEAQFSFVARTEKLTELYESLQVASSRR
jgi:glycosyltransferase involved in cell wall biosynthesis